MAFWMAIPAVISAVGALSSAASASKQNKQQLAWNNYNSTMDYNTAMGNISSQLMLTKANVGFLQQAEAIEQQRLKSTAEFNSATILSVASFNNSLLDREEELMWEGLDLDLSVLHAERAREKGEIIAAQAASGTVIGEGSNADVVAAQMTQEALDASVLRHGANIQASRLLNSKLMNNYNANMEYQKIMWEAQMGSYVSQSNTNLQAMGMITEGVISAMANGASAENALRAGQQGANMNYSTNSSKINSGLTNSLFSAAGQGVASYYGSKVPSVPSGSTGVSSAGSSTFVPAGSGYTFGSGYTQSYSLLAT